MADLLIKAVSSRRERKQFLELPWELYRGDPNWIPPLRMDQKELVNYKKHPFYEKNRIQTFLAYRGKEVVGRIAAILNQGHLDRYNDQRGFFGFFECRDDQEAANGLFDAVRAWFAEQGIPNVRGPANPSLNYTVGTLVEGFDTPPTFMMTYNPPYHEKLILGAGFQKSQDLYAYWGEVEMLPKMEAKLKPIALKIIEHLGLKLRSMDRKHFNDDVMQFLNIYNRALTNTWGFVPLSDAEVRHMATGLRFLIIPELTVGAELDGKLIGISFCMPDYNPRIKQIDGRLFPFGFLRLLWNRRNIKHVRLISTNVLPEYQYQGVGLALMYALVPPAMAFGIRGAEFSWVLESNALSRGSLEKGGAIRTKTYRVYDWPAG